MCTGTTGTRRLVARSPIPSRIGPIRPSAERVPSGNTITLKPSFTRSATRSSEARMSDERPNGMAPRASSVGRAQGAAVEPDVGSGRDGGPIAHPRGSAARTTGASRWLVWLGQMSTGPAKPGEVLGALDPQPGHDADGPADEGGIEQPTQQPSRP